MSAGVANAPPSAGGADTAGAGAADGSADKPNTPHPVANTTTPAARPAALNIVASRRRTPVHSEDGHTDAPVVIAAESTRTTEVTMRCDDGVFVNAIRETEPVPDEKGDLWRTVEATGHFTFACSHGLTISGPHEQVAPLVRLHTGIKPLGSEQSVLSSRA